MRNFLKSCKGRSSRLETLFQCGFLTVTWERFLNNATHRKESLLRLNISSPRADHSVPTNFHSLQNYSTAKHCSKQGFWSCHSQYSWICQNTGRMTVEVKREFVADFTQPSVQLSCSVVSNSLRPHGLQPAKLPCPSPTPRACSNSSPSSGWCHPTISSSDIPFSSCLQLSHRQSLFQWISSLHQVAEVSVLQHQSFQWIFRADFLKSVN